MKLTKTQIQKLIDSLVTIVSILCAALCVHSCTLSLSVQKNNSSSTQKVEQTTTVDSLKNIVNYGK